MDLRDNILDDVSSLKRSAHIYENIKSIAENILSDMRDKIHESSQEGQNHIVYELPSLLMVSGLSNRDAQYIVIASIVKALEKKDYEVCVESKAHSIYMLITWLSDKDKRYVSDCKKVVDDHYKNFMEKEAN